MAWQDYLTIKLGRPFIGYASGLRYNPDYIKRAGQTLAAPATRGYYVPYLVKEPVTFTGITTWNQGTGDNTDRYRQSLYTNVNGKPGALIQDIGEVTLDNTSAIRTITATINLEAYDNAWIWVLTHFRDAISMYDMQAVSAGGEIADNTVEFGSFGNFFAAANPAPVFRYFDGTYGAAPSTPVAATGSVAAAPAFAFER